MKAHLIVKLKRPIANRLPYWEEIIKKKSGVYTSFFPKIDELLHSYHLSVWPTTEFQPANGLSWDEWELKSGFNRIYRLIFQQNREIQQEMVEAIRHLPEVESARIGGIGQSQLPQFQISESKALRHNWRTKLLFIEDSHHFSKGHPDVIIAVLDTGIAQTHPEISHALMPGKDFVHIIDGAMSFIGDFLDYDDSPDDEVGHGTHVSGILVAKGDKMPVGIAPKCKILPIRVLGALKQGNSVVGAGLIDNINAGIKWAVDNGAQVINMSLGIRHEGGGLPHAEVINYAISKGVTVVAASGNDGSMDKYYPGALPGVIAVSACDENGQEAAFSTGGGHVSFMAPGTNIFSTFPPDGYAFSSGTSQAAPFVAGGIALLKSYALQHDRTLSDSQVKYLLTRTTDRPGRQYKTPKGGYGNVNMLDAMKLLDYLLKSGKGKPANVSSVATSMRI